MAVGIGASGFIGIALEATPGTYTPPTKFFPIDSESLQYQQDTQWRTPIRQTADKIGAIDGDVHTEGDLSMDALPDVVVYFLLCARTAGVKAADSATPVNYTYTFTPTDAAVPVKTMSITLIRNGQVFGYTGIVVSSFNFTIDTGVLKFNPSLIGSDEDTETVPTPTWSESLPYGAGSYDVQIPTSTQIFDADTFTFTVEDNGTPNYRLKNTGRGAQFISFGERDVTVALDRDFQNRTEYEAFKALTSKSVTVRAEHSATDFIEMTAPVAIIDTFDLALGGQGDLVRSSITYRGIIDSEGKAYQIDICTTEELTDVADAP